MAVQFLRYEQGSGRLYRCRPAMDCVLLARGYSGYMEHANAPDSQGLTGRGPIPRGVWSVGVPYNHPRLGPLAFPLSPEEVTVAHRSGFFIHGDNARGDRSGSHGCIIMPRNVRAALADDVRARRITRLVVIL